MVHSWVSLSRSEERIGDEVVQRRGNRNCARCCGGVVPEKRGKKKIQRIKLTLEYIQNSLVYLVKIHTSDLLWLLMSMQHSGMQPGGAGRSVQVRPPPLDAQLSRRSP